MSTLLSKVGVVMDQM